MTLSATEILAATLRFAGWQFAFLAASIPLARALGFGRFRRAEEQLLAVLAIDVTLEASLAGLFSFLGVNSSGMYWVAAAAGLIVGRNAFRQMGRSLARLEIFRYPRTC